MKKGFTLIELLAVIIVLAIIALIATPLVMDTIKNIKKETAEINAQAYINRVDIMVKDEKLKKNRVEDGIYLVNEEGHLCKEEDTVECDNPYIVGVKGEKPAVGSKIAIEKGRVVKKASNYPTEQTVIVTSDKQYMTTFNEEEKLVTTLIKVYNNGEAVYYDVNTGKSCNNYHDDNSKTGYNGTNESKTTDNQNRCLKFYAFNDSEESDRVKLILDHNTTAGISWNASFTNTTGPDTAFLTQLTNDTTGWVAETPGIYTDPAKNYTINYTTKARLITANEVAQITGNTSFNSAISTDYFYFDINTQERKPTCKYGDTSGCRYGWLYDRTSPTCKDAFGCLNDAVGADTYGYWTSSAYSGNSSYAWYVNHDSGLHYNDASDSEYDGIRPVIEVLKSNL